MPKGLRVFAVVALIVGVIVLVLAGVWTWFNRQAFPKTSGTVEVAGLSRPVEIIRDEYGVAHIYALTPEDLYFAQGYVHAQERFWQMEFQRRIGAGRMSEIFGETTLGTDRFLRQFGFYDLAEQAYELMDEEVQAAADAYAAGVNAYIGDRSPGKLGLEFALLGVQGVKVEIEPWSPPDSLVWAEMLIFNQANVPPTELDLVDLIAQVGEEMAGVLALPYPDDRPTIIPPGELLAGEPAARSLAVALGPEAISYLKAAGRAAQEQNVVPEILDEMGLFRTAASNSFAVSGEKTTTGKPILAEDPHMGIDIPALWYEIGLHCVEKSEECLQNMRGFSLPGVPGILIGHNDRIAWGLTNAFFDAEDTFVERINPLNPNQYEVNGEWVDMEIRREEIVVRGRDEPDVLLVRKTRNGLVLTDEIIDQTFFALEEDGTNFYALSMAWTALDPILSMQAVFKANIAQNWDEFIEALRDFDAGKQNWLYADVDGNIGYNMPGKVPIRAGGDGTLPVPGWNDDYQWTGFIPYEEAPRMFNPDQGFIVAANNPQLREDEYPYLIARFHDRGMRARRITELITADRDGISLEDAMAFQTDNQSLPALKIIPFLVGVDLDNPSLEAARDRLLAWDCQMLMNSPEAALFNIFYKHLVIETFHDQVDARQANGNPYTADGLISLLEQPDDPWWDDIRTDNVAEFRDAIYRRAFEKAWEEGVGLFGEDLDTWRWGDLHTKEFRNATLGNSGIGLIEGIFNRGPVAVGGSGEVPNKTDWNVNNPYHVTGVIPALRQVVDLGDLGNSQMIHAVGQSGHPMHDHYDDFIDVWRTFNYHPSNWERADAEAGDHDILILEPAS